MLKTKAIGRGFNTFQSTWWMLMHWTTMFHHYYCIKTENILPNFCIISCTILFCLFNSASQMQFPPTMLILSRDDGWLLWQCHEQGKLIRWPQYEHTESWVAMHQQCVNFLLIYRFSPVNAGLLITYSTAFAFYAIIRINQEHSISSKKMHPTNSDQPAYPCILISVFAVHMKTL